MNLSDMQPHPDLCLEQSQTMSTTEGNFVSCFVIVSFVNVIRFSSCVKPFQHVHHRSCIGKVVGRRGVSTEWLHSSLLVLFWTSSVRHTLLHPWRCPRTGLRSLHHPCLSDSCSRRHSIAKFVQNNARHVIFSIFTHCQPLLYNLLKCLPRDGIKL